MSGTYDTPAGKIFSSADRGQTRDTLHLHLLDTQLVVQLIAFQAETIAEGISVPPPGC